MKRLALLGLVAMLSLGACAGRTGASRGLQIQRTADTAPQETTDISRPIGQR